MAEAPIDGGKCCSSAAYRIGIRSQSEIRYSCVGEVAVMKHLSLECNAAIDKGADQWLNDFLRSAARIPDSGVALIWHASILSSQTLQSTHLIL